MNVEFTIKNYRCFQDSSPARFVLRNGCIAFVGVNNAGKSTILKFFYEFRNLFGLLAQPSTELQQTMNGALISFNPNLGNRNVHELFCKQNSRDLLIEIEFLNSNDSSQVSLQKLQKIRIRITHDRPQFTLEIIEPNKKYDPQRPFQFSNSILHEGGNAFLDFTQFFNLFTNLIDSLYIGSFRNAINSGNGNSYYDIQVGQDFINQWRNYKMGSDTNQNEAAFQLTNDIRDIFGFETLEINPSQDNSDLKLLIEGKSYTLSELGGGIAQFIIVLANAAIRKPAFILIDEPELNLHPKLQLEFVSTLKVYAKQGVIFTTHSLGLARSSAEMIYSVHVNNGNRIITPLEKLPRLSEFLGELNFSGYQDLGFTKLLLVEGTTEVTLIQQFLRKFNKDHEIVILPLGGSSLINAVSDYQLEELRRITHNIAALIDSEKEYESQPVPEDRKKFTETCKTLGIDCHILEYRAIENYFSERAIQTVMKSPKYRALENYEKLGNMDNAWGKSDNWRIAREMELSELEGTDLYTFLKNL